MLTIHDCIALSDLTEDEVDAIAEHEHVPNILAVELGCCLVHSPDGQRRIATFIREDIERACRHGKGRHAADLAGVLQEFVAHHRGMYGIRNIDA